MKNNHIHVRQLGLRSMQFVLPTSLHMEPLVLGVYVSNTEIFNYFFFLNVKLKTRQAMANVIPRAASV